MGKCGSKSAVAPSAEQPDPAPASQSHDVVPVTVPDSARSNKVSARANVAPQGSSRKIEQNAAHLPDVQDHSRDQPSARAQIAEISDEQAQTKRKNSREIQPSQDQQTPREVKKRESVASVQPIGINNRIFSEEDDDAFVIRHAFDCIDSNKNQMLTVTELTAASKHEIFKEHTDFIDLLKKKLHENPDLKGIDFETFKDIADNVPRGRGHRVQWAKNLGLEGEFAKHLKVGTLFDGLKGVKSMSKKEIQAACAEFAKEVPKIVEAAWASLQQTQSHKAEAKEANSKFSMTPGAYTGKFATLDDFYKGPEEIIGSPNPNLFVGMKREHCLRSNRKTLFTTPNYNVTTCPDWEWRFVVSPHNPPNEPGFQFPHCPAVQDRSEWAGRDGSEKWKGTGRDVQDLSMFMELSIVRRAGLVKEEVIAMRLYTGPMYVLYNAVLRSFPQSLVDSLQGNRYETTIFSLCSGITKMSKQTKVPENRLLFRGLGGMLLPEEFWKGSAENGFKGGVEFGLMSTTTSKETAVQYSGIDKKRAIIFEIQAGRIDIGASLELLSQYPGEEEFLMQPLSCLEVIGRPRVELTPDGERKKVLPNVRGEQVIVFPLRVNVNLKTVTVEELLQRRKVLHLAMVKNLREEYEQTTNGWVEEFQLNSFDAGEFASTPMGEPISSFPSFPLNGTLGPGSLTASTGPVTIARANATMQAKDRLTRAADIIGNEFDKLVKEQASMPPGDFNVDGKYKTLTTKAIDAKVLTLKKMDFYLHEVERCALAAVALATGVNPTSNSADGYRSGNYDEYRVDSAKPGTRDGYGSTLRREMSMQRPGTRGTAASATTAAAGRELSSFVKPGADKASATAAQGAVWDDEFLKRILEAPFEDFAQEGIEMALRTGVQGFPWQEISARKQTIILTNWSPANLTRAQLQRAREVLATEEGFKMVRAVEFGGRIVTFKDGLMAADINLDEQAVQGHLKSAAFLMSVNANLRSLSIRNTSVELGELVGALWELEGCYNFNSINGYEWSSLLLAREGRQMQAFELSKRKIVPEEANVLSAVINCRVTSLVALHLSSCELGPEGGTAVGNCLSSLEALTSCDLSDNGLRKEGGTAIANGLRALTSLQRLNLQKNELSNEGWEMVVGALDRCEQVGIINDMRWTKSLLAGRQETISLRSEKLGADGAALLASLLSRSSWSLKSLELSSANLLKEGSVAVASGLFHVTNLRSLSLEGNKMGKDGMAAVAKGMQHLRNLESLDLGNNDLSDDGGKILADALRHVTSLQSLQIRYNKLMSQGIEAIAGALHFVPNLQILNLGSNDIVEKAIKKLAEGFQHVPRLTSLNLEMNVMRKEGGTALMEGLKHLPNLETIKLRDTFLADTVVDRIKKVVKNVEYS